MKICNEDGCSTVSRSLGLCNKHYDKQRRNKRMIDSENLKTTRNMTMDEYEYRLWVLQNGRCAVCKMEAPAPYEEVRRWPVDHDHKCCPSRKKSCGECTRGILCIPCNSALNSRWDEDGWLDSALEYLGRV